MKRAKKIEDIAILAKKLMQQGAYAISQHAKLRQNERCFNLGDIKNIINTGFHEKKKTNIKMSMLIGIMQSEEKL